jgi:CBS domain-containing protein
MQIKELMSTPVVSVTPGTPLKQVAHLLLENEIDGVPVVDHGAVIGFVSETDVVATEQGPDEAVRPGRLARVLHRPPRTQGRPYAETAADVMTAPAVVVEPWESVWCAACVLCEHHVHQLPVVQDGRLVGIVARSDLMRAYDRPDDDVAAEIRDVVLPALGLCPALFDIDVVDGHVTVGGWFEREGDSAMLARAARRVPGVVSVDLRLEDRPTIHPRR